MTRLRGQEDAEVLARRREHADRLRHLARYLDGAAGGRGDALRARADAIEAGEDA